MRGAILKWGRVAKAVKEEEGGGKVTARRMSDSMHGGEGTERKENGKRGQLANNCGRRQLAVVGRGTPAMQGFGLMPGGGVML